MSENRSEDQARAQYESICEMVAALDVDYDRLDELKEGLGALQYGFKSADDDRQAFVRAGDVEGAALRTKECGEAQDALDEWNAENSVELTELQQAANDCENHDAARDRIQEDPLSVLVRSGWCSPGDDAPFPEEFEILLCTGGPAVRIRGELDEHGQPTKAWLEHQDWGTPWKIWYFDADPDVLLRYCQGFYFGG